MTTAAEKSSVEFTESGAIYRPGNGHTITYKKKINGVFYHADTPDAVVRALELARSSRQRIRICLGDVTTGRSWHEEHDVEGTIGNSLGPLKVPLLIHSRRSHGGLAILDHCLIRIKLRTGTVLYQHARYHTGTFTVREIGPNEVVHGQRLVGLGYTHGVDLDGQPHANFRSLKAAERFIRRMTT